MLRFYKYMIYRLYTWRLRSKDGTPVTTTELLMLLLHLVQLATIWDLINVIFPNINSNIATTPGLVIAVGLQVAYHFLIYNKERWHNYIDMFENESASQRKKGTALIIVYTAASYLLFILSLVLMLIYF
jgi:hypothetical protein